MAYLEHLNMTVADPAESAALFCALFGWKVRWKGAAIHGGESWHVGNDSSYVVFYRPPEGAGAAVPAGESYRRAGGFNHLGVVVEDLDAVEARVRAAGFEPFNHASYNPGRRFYFREMNGVEVEVVSYG